MRHGDHLLLDHARLAPAGHFMLEVRRLGAVIEVVDEPNIVVALSKGIHSNLLGGAADFQVSQIGYGAGSAPPAVGNIRLTGAYTKALDSVSYPSSGQVQFAFSLDVDEANGLSISEFGLLTAGNILYARKTRSARLVKDDTISLSGTWTITF